MFRPHPRLIPVVIVLLSCLAILPALEAQESTWQNQSGSTLSIEDVDSEGLITGYYINRASGFGCQNTPYPVTGWVLPGTNTITFTVKWENTTQNCQSLTAWTGFFSADGQTITTLWQLVVNGTTSTGQILKGSDTFTLVGQTVTDFVEKPAAQ